MTRIGFEEFQKRNSLIGRLAPSPTGYSHLGNAWSYLLTWLFVRSNGGILILRMDDIDPQRSKKEFARCILEDLKWLGLDWDCGPGIGRDGDDYVQSHRLERYELALEVLERQNLIYPCFCTRRELRLIAAAPHIGDAGAPYSGACANLDHKTAESLMRQGKPYSSRLRCPEGEISFADLIQGNQTAMFSGHAGDFALRRSDGVMAYQLASVVDDALMNVNFVSRGRDLLASTFRQIILQGLLGYARPWYAHLPLLLGLDGERLAKRHKSLSLRALRAQGVKPEQITGLFGRFAGINPSGGPLPAAALLKDFNWRKLPKEDITLHEADLAALAPQ